MVRIFIAVTTTNKILWNSGETHNQGNQHHLYLPSYHQKDQENISCDDLRIDTQTIKDYLHSCFRVTKIPKKGKGACFSMSKASIASLLFHSTGHPSITEWERGTDSIAQSQRSSRASSREKERERGKVKNRKQRQWVRRRQSQVWKREIHKDRAREHERDRNATQRSCSVLWLSSITLPEIFPSLWVPSWPFGSMTPVSAAISQPGPVTLLLQHTQPVPVVSRAWTLHHCCRTEQILWRTKRNSWAADLGSTDDG